MRSLSTSLLVVALGAVLAADATAQVDRLVRFGDGRADEPVTTQGHARWVTGADQVRDGITALRVAPGDKDAYWGVTLTGVPTLAADALSVAVFLEGTQPAAFRLRLGDVKSGNGHGGKDAALTTETLQPGWNALQIKLRSRVTSANRPLDFLGVVHNLELSKKKEAGDTAIIVDGVRALQAAPPDRKRFLDAFAATEKDPLARIHMLHDNLGVQDDATIAAVALPLLATERQPRFRRAAREALARVTDPAVTATILTAAKAADPADRPELYWAIGATPSRAGRARALEMVRDKKLSVSDRTALVTGLTLPGAGDVAGTADSMTANGPWQPQAALVRALFTAADRTAMDGLITLLGEARPARVIDDTEAALVALTGKDLGRSGQAWRDWWVANREKADLGSKSERRTAGYAGGTFYGLPVPKGRVAFVLDTSGSMREPVGGGKLDAYLKTAKHLEGKKIATRLQLAGEELAHAIETTPDGTACALITFGNAEVWLSNGLEVLDLTTRARLAGKVRYLQAGQKTNMYAGLWAAFHPAKKPATTDADIADGPDTVFLLTDGNPSAGKWSRYDDLADEVLAWNLGRAIKINTVNVGDADARLLSSLAENSGGTFKDLRSDKPSPPGKP